MFKIMENQNYIDEARQPVVLVVDDLPENIFILTQTLKETGYKLEIAGDGNEAIRKVYEIKPDLILLDILLTGLDGYQVCKVLKEDPLTSYIPIIFLSALNDFSDIVEGFRAGGIDYITKPYNIPEVIARVQTHVELKMSRDLNDRYIEKLKSTNEELNLKEKMLRELNASKDKFFSIIAHDLKNPFQGFLKLSELMLEDFSEMSRDDLKEYIVHITSSAKKLDKLLENLLTWSKLQLGTSKVNKVNQNLSFMIQNCLMIFNNNIIDKNIQIINEADPALEVYADVNMISTTIRNLTSNAIKFSPKSGTIKLSTFEENGFIWLSVMDNGVGMSAEDQTKLFAIDTQFIRNGTAGETGTGLGLILCKELVEKNGGTFTIESKEGLGTTVRFSMEPSRPDVE
jgi:two-component system, sensor histidine kinase and response regulator